jgi:hypothetical protein
MPQLYAQLHLDIRVVTVEARDLLKFKMVIIGHVNVTVI